MRQHDCHGRERQDRDCKGDTSWFWECSAARIRRTAYVVVVTVEELGARQCGRADRPAIIEAMMNVQPRTQFTVFQESHD